MARKRVLISVGPIPARLDSVKFITNRFKGGLAIKTANHLVDKGMDVTAVAWKFTDVTGLRSGANIVKVLDVYEYCDYIKEHATEFDAFVMAAAVANLSPTHPYEDKFPSHLYKVGDKFNIEFEIAPRAIDIVKQVNPRCCLIGYKLFDAKTDEELIEIARHTLHDSKANIIFANTPAEAKTRKVALFQDNTVLETDFNGHMDLIVDAINSAYFRTEVDATIFDDMPIGKRNKIEMCKKIVEKFEENLIDGFGTIAIRVSDDNDFVATSRGHKGMPVYVKSINIESGVITAEAKATLNAPAMYAFIQKGFDYAIHKHDLYWHGKYGDTDSIEIFDEYVFPGTFIEYIKVRQALNMQYGEAESVEDKEGVREKGHGYIAGYKAYELNWENYYSIFGKAYESYPSVIQEMIDETDREDWLDVGCNTKTTAKYVLDPYIKLDGKENLSYEEDHTNRFKLITLKNSINYLKDSELKKLITWLQPGGVIIANSFAKSPSYRLKDKEAIYTEDGIVHHYFIFSESTVYKHTFRDTNIDMLKDLGFEVSYYNDFKSVLLRYNK